MTLCTRRSMLLSSAGLLGAVRLSAALRSEHAATPRFLLLITAGAAAEELNALAQVQALQVRGCAFSAARAAGSDRNTQIHALLGGNEASAGGLPELLVQQQLPCALVTAGAMATLEPVAAAAVKLPRVAVAGLRAAPEFRAESVPAALSAALRLFGQSVPGATLLCAQREILARGLMQAEAGADAAVRTAIEAGLTFSVRLQAALTVVLLPAPEESRAAWLKGVDLALVTVAAHAERPSLIFAGLPRPQPDAKEPPRMALLFEGAAFKTLGVVRSGGGSLDVAPTLAHALGVKLAAPRGNVLRSVLA